jgi:hypothetical protein
MSYTINPKTGKRILVGGPTYVKLAKTKWADKLSPRPSAELREGPKGRGKSGSKAGGCSRQHKYIGKGIPEAMFCGLEGDACAYTYPVNTPRRAVAALAYARHAPNPAGIKRCAKRIAKEKGWIDPQTGKIKVKGRGKK